MRGFFRLLHGMCSTRDAEVFYHLAIVWFKCCSRPALYLVCAIVVGWLALTHPRLAAFLSVLIGAL